MTTREPNREIFDAAARKIKLIFFFSVIGLVAIYAYAYLDQPINTGNKIKGKVVSTAVVQDGYRSVNAATNATIRLDNGALISKILPSAAVGNVVELSIYKRRITGVTEYK